MIQIGISGVGLLGLLVAALLWIPGDLYLKWRKPWGGSLVVWLQIRWLKAVIHVQARRYRWQWFYWQGSQTWNRDPSVLINQNLFPAIKHLIAAQPTDQSFGQLYRQVTVEGWLELGLRDPALTGQWIGYLGGLPLPLASRIQLRFDRVGWRSRGWLQVRLTPYQVLRILYKTRQLKKKTTSRRD
jgi:hypothetical protein